MSRQLIPRIATALWKALRHPMMAVVFLTGLSLWIGEFFPFSHYPMYGNPSSRPVDYHYITDGAGEPIPIEEITLVSPPKIKKIFRKRTDTRAGELGLKRADLPDAERTAIAADILKYLRETAVRRQRELPPSMRFVEAWVSLADDGFAETEAVLAED